MPRLLPPRLPLPRVAAALVTGVALPLISPPVNLTWLEWVYVLPLFWALREGAHRENAWLAYLSGWTSIFFIFFWLIETIVRFSNVPTAVAFLLHLVFTSFFSLPFLFVFGPARWIREKFGPWWMLWLPAAQAGAEFAFPALFPYNIGACQYTVPLIWQLASVLGVTGVSALVLLPNVVLAEWMWSRQEGRAPPIKAGIATLLALGATVVFSHFRYGSVESAMAEAKTLRVAMLQQDVSMEVRLESSPIEGLRDWIKLTREAAEHNPDLVVWPEGAVIFNPNSEDEARVLGNRSPRQFFEEMTSKGGFDLLVGGGTYEPLSEDPNDYLAYNSCYVFRDDLGLSGRYDKMVPLPFGEYIPLGEYVPWVRTLIRGPGNFRAGTTPTFFEAKSRDGRDYRFTAPICYEAILTGQMWKMFADDRGAVDLFVNITNDAWFGDTSCPHQHGMMAAIQSTHFGRPLLRIAYTGISFIAEPHGQVRDQFGFFEEAAEVRELRMGAVPTLFVSGGWLFPWLCLFGTLGTAIYGRFRGRAAGPEGEPA